MTTDLQEILNVNMEKKIISESKLLGAMQDWLTDCDKDVLCELAKRFFGGEFVSLGFMEDKDDEYFEVIPDDNYMGAFDN